MNVLCWSKWSNKAHALATLSSLFLKKELKHSRRGHESERLSLARRRLRPARRIWQFDRDGCRTAGFSRLARILERQDQRELNGETPEYASPV
jgi:hypothetical protein